MEEKQEKFVRKILIAAMIFFAIGAIIIPINNQSEIKTTEYTGLSDAEKIGALLHEAEYDLRKGKVYSAMLSCILAQDCAKNLGVTLPKGTENFISKVERIYKNKNQKN